MLGHIIIGFLVGFYLKSSYLHLLFILIGSLLPDIDTENSTLGKYFILNRFGFIKHRGFFHTIFGAAIISSPLLFFNFTAFKFTFIGAIFHILGDKIHSILFSSRKFKIKLF